MTAAKWRRVTMDRRMVIEIEPSTTCGGLTFGVSQSDGVSSVDDAAVDVIIVDDEGDAARRPPKPPQGRDEHGRIDRLEQVMTQVLDEVSGQWVSAW